MEQCWTKKDNLKAIRDRALIHLCLCFLFQLTAMKEGQQARQTELNQISSPVLKKSGKNVQTWLSSGSNQKQQLII